MATYCQLLHLSTLGLVNRISSTASTLSQTQSKSGVSIISRDKTGFVSRWRGHVLRLQQAKESFMSRLVKERQEREQKFKSTTQQDLNYDPIQMMKERNAKEGSTVLRAQMCLVLQKCYGKNVTC